jgi:transcriptional regulator with XRE-family HTH domain
MSKRDLQKFGKRLKALRIDKGLTQLELAERLDMSPNFVGMIERGERNTTVENIFKISRALGIKPSNLFEEL